MALGHKLVAAAGFALIAVQTLTAGEYIVDINGPKGAAFGGSCLMITAGSSASHVVAGSVPVRLGFSGDSISCAIQPKVASASLQIVIKNSKGLIVGESSELLPFGVVIAAGR